MTDTPDESALQRMLTDVFPVFPLQGCILLPRAQLPLNIFEPRYLAMTRDAMAGHRLIGIIQPVGLEDRDKPKSAKPMLFGIGCLGKIDSFSETKDGRFLISLTGLTRFKVSQELECVTPYRQVRADFDPFAGDPRIDAALSGELRGQVVQALRSYLDGRGMGADWDAVNAAEPEQLINGLAMVCPFSSGEKQALLEAQSLTERAQLLVTLMAFSGASDAPDVRH
jgi:uncharacterized protein